jgi:hypothetical protein
MVNIYRVNVTCSHAAKGRGRGGRGSNGRGEGGRWLASIGMKVLQTPTVALAFILLSKAQET